MGRLLAVMTAACVGASCHLAFSFEETERASVDLGGDLAPDVARLDAPGDGSAGESHPREAASLADRPRETTASCTCGQADLTLDGKVDMSDFGLLQVCLGRTPLPTSCVPADFNHDGAVDASDLACLSSWMGKTCP